MSWPKTLSFPETFSPFKDLYDRLSLRLVESPRDPERGGPLLSPDFKKLLLALFEGQETFDAVRKTYEPGRDDAVLLKAMLFNFYCVRNSRNFTSSLLDQDLQPLLAQISEQKLLARARSKRRRNVLRSAFPTILRRAGLLGKPGLARLSMKNDLFTVGFIRRFIREASSPERERIRAEVEKETELLELITSNFRKNFRNSIDRWIRAAWTALARPGASDWRVRFQARMALSPLDFKSVYPVLRLSVA